MNARDYLALLRERKLLIGACVVLCLAVATVVTVLTPRSYASTVTFYVVAGSTSTPAGASDNFQGAQLSTDRVKSYTELLTSRRVAEDAAVLLRDGTTADEVGSAVSASSVTDTVIITLTATDRSPTRAKAIATAVSSAFTRLVRVLETPNATAAGAAPSAPVDTPGGTPAVTPAVTAQVLQPPSQPGDPVSPWLKLNLAIGLIVGLVLGFGAAVARRSLDVAVRTAEELGDAVGAPVLGEVPEDGTAAAQPVAITAADGRGSARAEAYRRIRTALDLRDTVDHHRVLVVTSAVPGEGRTSTACNLAATLAAVGARVLLVDADLRGPKVATYLDLDQESGLTAVVTGRTTLDRAIRRLSAEHFDALPSGPAVPRPNELVSSRRMADLIATMRSRYDHVIIDAPPLLDVADAANLGRCADGVVLVCRWGHTARPQVESAVSFLRSVAVPVAGAILTRTPPPRRTRPTRYGAAVADTDNQATTAAATTDAATDVPRDVAPNDATTELRLPDLAEPVDRTGTERMGGISPQNAK